SGDGAALARLVAARAAPEGGALLHARGREVAADPAEALAEAGFTVRPAVLYEAQAASALWPVLRERIVAGDIDAVLLFSPGTAEASAGMDAVCLSQAVAEAASPLPWRAVRIAASPDQAALIKELDHAAGKPGDRPAVTEGSEPKKTVPSTLEKAAAKDSAKG